MRPGAADRLRRMLAVLAYLAEVGSASIDELSGRFSLTPERMRADLEVMRWCGATATEYLELEVVGDDVVAHLPYYLQRPLRLSRAEGLAVLTAGRTLAAIPGADSAPLEEALDALADALGFDDDQVDVVLDRPEFLTEVRAAADAHQTVDLTYYSRWRDTRTERRVDPLRVALADGDWYLDAWDHGHDALRKFRVSRIEAVGLTGDTYDRHVDLGPPSSFEAPPDAVEVRLLLPADASWAAEVYPGELVAEHDDASFEFVLHAVGTSWLERLLLRAGPAARVLAPADLVDLPADAARRLLGAYADSPHS